MRPGIFFDTFERQFGQAIPPSVRRAINLFWANADDAIDIIESYADRSNEEDYALQVRHRSLNATTLLAYSEELYYGMLNWFSDNAYELAKLCFSMGAVCDSEEWSDFIWYKNLVDEKDVDEKGVDEKEVDEKEVGSEKVLEKESVENNIQVSKGNNVKNAIEELSGVVIKLNQLDDNSDEGIKTDSFLADNNDMINNDFNISLSISGNAFLTLSNTVQEIMFLFNA